MLSLLRLILSSLKTTPTDSSGQNTSGSWRLNYWRTSGHNQRSPWIPLVALLAAICSLVVGIQCVWFGPGRDLERFWGLLLLVLVSSTCGLAGAARGWGWDRGGGGPARLALRLMAISIGATFLLFLFNSHGSPRAMEINRRKTCKENLQQVGNSLREYSKVHGGRFPDSLQELLDLGKLSPSLLVCPSTKDLPLKKWTCGTPLRRHISYWYRGSQVRSADSILMYELPENHDHDGIHVLYADGHVSFEPFPYAEKILSDVQSGEIAP